MNLRDIVGRPYPNLTWEVEPMEYREAKDALKEFKATNPRVVLRPRSDWREFATGSVLTAKVGTRIRVRLEEDGHAEVVHARTQVKGIGKSKHQRNHMIEIPPEGERFTTAEALWLLTRYSAYLEDVIDGPSAKKPKKGKVPQPGKAKAAKE